MALLLTEKITKAVHGGPFVNSLKIKIRSIMRDLIKNTLPHKCVISSDRNGSWNEIHVSISRWAFFLKGRKMRKRITVWLTKTFSGFSLNEKGGEEVSVSRSHIAWSGSLI